MLFYQVGELFQSYAVGKSRKSIAALMDIRPDYANVERDGAAGAGGPGGGGRGRRDRHQGRGESALGRRGAGRQSSLVNTAALTGESRSPAGAARGRRHQRLYQPERPAAGAGDQRPLGNPLWPRFWIWWKTPAAKKPKQKTSSPDSPGTIRPVVVICAVVLAIGAPLVCRRIGPVGCRKL